MSEKVEMTLADALDKRKVLISKMEKAKMTLNSLTSGANGGVTSLFPIVTAADDKVDCRSKISIGEVSTTCEANIRSIVDTMKNIEVLDAVISQANASTIIKVSDKEYTIASAIALKNRIAGSIDSLIAISNAFNSANREAARLTERDTSPMAVAEYLKAVMKEKNQTTDDIANLTTSYINSKTLVVVDPNDVVKNVIEKEIDRLQGFVVEFQSAIIRANYMTNVEVEFV